MRTTFYVDNFKLDPTRQKAAASDEIAVVAYLDTDDDEKISEVLERLSALRELAGYGPQFDIHVKRGSIFFRARSAMSRALSSSEVTDRLTKLERAAELAYVDMKQAEYDSKEAEAVQKLLESTQDISRVCMRLGSILFVKFQTNGESTILVRNLTQIEIRALERCPENQAIPELAISSLAAAVDSMESIETVGRDSGAGSANAGG